MISSDEELPKTEPSLRYFITLEENLRGERRVKLRKLPMSPLRKISENRRNMFSPRKMSTADGSPKKSVIVTRSPRYSHSPKKSSVSSRSVNSVDAKEGQKPRRTREEKLDEKDISDLLNADESGSSESSDIDDEDENEAPYSQGEKSKVVCDISGAEVLNGCRSICVGDKLNSLKHVDSQHAEEMQSRREKWIASLMKDDFSKLSSLKMKIKRGEMSPSPPKSAQKHKNCHVDSRDEEKEKRRSRNSLKRNCIYSEESDDPCEQPSKRKKVLESKENNLQKVAKSELKKDSKKQRSLYDADSVEDSLKTRKNYLLENASSKAVMGHVNYHIKEGKRIKERSETSFCKVNDSVLKSPRKRVASHRNKDDSGESDNDDAVKNNVKSWTPRMSARKKSIPLKYHDDSQDSDDDIFGKNVKNEKNFSRSPGGKNIECDKYKDDFEDSDSGDVTNNSSVKSVRVSGRKRTAPVKYRDCDIILNSPRKSAKNLSQPAEYREYSEENGEDVKMKNCSFGFGQISARNFNRPSEFEDHSIKSDNNVMKNSNSNSLRMSPRKRMQSMNFKDDSMHNDDNTDADNRNFLIQKSTKKKDKPSKYRDDSEESDDAIKASPQVGCSRGLGGSEIRPSKYEANSVPFSNGDMTKGGSSTSSPSLDRMRSPRRAVASKYSDEEWVLASPSRKGVRTPTVKLHKLSPAIMRVKESLREQEAYKRTPRRSLDTVLEEVATTTPGSSGRKSLKADGRNENDEELLDSSFAPLGHSPYVKNGDKNEFSLTDSGKKKRKPEEEVKVAEYSSPGSEKRGRGRSRKETSRESFSSIIEKKGLEASPVEGDRKLRGRLRKEVGSRESSPSDIKRKEVGSVESPLADGRRTRNMRGKGCLSPGSTTRSKRTLKEEDSDSINSSDSDYEIHTPKKNSSATRTCKTVRSPGTPQTPKRMAPSSPVTPSSRRGSGRKQMRTPSMPTCKRDKGTPQTPLQEAMTRLHVSAVPQSLPCREMEFANIYRFLEGKILDGAGGCMYISGVPGTGKTATVRAVVRNLKHEVKTEDLPDFQFVEVNGMSLTQPRQVYVQIWKALAAEVLTAEQAQRALENKFTQGSKKNIPTVLLVDELDVLWTRKQDVIYNLLDWPAKAGSQLVVVTIANTMDLPERLLMGRVTSRLGLTRLTFQPYTFRQLEEIVKARLKGINAFDDDAVQFVSRKVASVSGDARRALDICRRATEIAEEESPDALVSIKHVDAALKAMTSSRPIIRIIQGCSVMEQLFLQAVEADLSRTGQEETTFDKAYSMMGTLCSLEGLQQPNTSNVLRICMDLSSSRLLLVKDFLSGIHTRILLNISSDDLHYALKEISMNANNDKIEKMKKKK